MLKVLSNILCDLDPKVKVIGQKAGICDGVPSTSALVISLKKSAEKPLSPGLLPLFIDFKVKDISDKFSSPSSLFAWFSVNVFMLCCSMYSCMSILSQMSYLLVYNFCNNSQSLTKFLIVCSILCRLPFPV